MDTQKTAQTQPLGTQWSECRRANNRRIDAIFAQLKRQRGLV